MPLNYNSRPENVQAVLLDDEQSFKQAAAWCGGAYTYSDEDNVAMLKVPTLLGTLSVGKGEYLVKNLETGTFYFLTKEDFEKKFTTDEIPEPKRTRMPNGFPASYPSTDAPVDPREVHRHRRGDDEYVGPGGVGPHPGE